MPAKDPEVAKLGIWLFLLTEILLFGGLFLLYAAYLYRFPNEFHVAGRKLSLFYGTFNTVIMLVSSWAIAMSISALHRERTVMSRNMLLLTVLLGLIFLMNKCFEWHSKISEGLYPNSSLFATKADGEVLFFGLYYLMTGLHGIHVLAGILLLSIMLIFVMKQKISASDFNKLENAGLYWHLVDVIWIFLLPMFYLAA